MVMNKKGFLKILEAIVAVLIVLGFIVAIIPEKPAPQAKLPPDLEQTANAILKELQEAPEFRSCVLEIEETTYTGIEGTGAECVFNYIDFITRPKPLHPWDYAARVCTVEEGDFKRCVYYGPNPANPLEGDFSLEGVSETEGGEFSVGDINTQISTLATNIGKNIYIKSITITVEDVLGAGSAGDASGSAAEDDDEGDDDPNESEVRPNVQRVITIFAWSKI